MGNAGEGKGVQINEWHDVGLLVDECVHVLL